MFPSTAGTIAATVAAAAVVKAVDADFNVSSLSQAWALSMMLELSQRNLLK
jgi:hypothetical protein